MGTEATAARLQHDGKVTIAIGRSRKDTRWQNRDMLWSQLVERLSTTTRTGETVAEYKALLKSQQDDIKDVGGFVGGPLKGGRRKSDAVSWRHLVTLDADHVTGDLWASVVMFWDFAVAMYSTHKHTPETPRLRLVIPLSRPVSPDEYAALSRKLADDLGIDMFDPSTFEAHRLMYWPSTSADGEFVFELQDAPWLDPDAVLAQYPDWRDPSYWPEPTSAKRERQRQAEKQGDPLEKPGVVGAFCRTYTISAAIEHFLADVYSPAGEGRYTYEHGTTTGGLVVYDDDRFAFSHHATDPVSGKLVNAFDLVRLHKFGHMDEDAAQGTPTVRLPSYLAMMKFANEDELVRQTMAEERVQAAAQEFGGFDENADHSWLRGLEYTDNGTLKQTIDNALLILENDPNLAGAIALNEFKRLPVLRRSVPWREVPDEAVDGMAWKDADDAALRHYVEKVYGFKSSTKLLDAFQMVAENHRFHPVRDYLSGLWWDGVPRVDTLLVDYLGAEDTPYVRAVTRKTLVAAAARIYEPGCKFDNMLVLVGPQGVGKSHLVHRLGGRWYSDSLVTVQGKEAFEALQDAWIIEMAELSATRKAEVENVKHFISKQRDRYRVAYGRHVQEFPRQCVFIGTTNDPEFLRDKTGNRRFWPVDVAQREPAKSLWGDMDQYEVDQIWAEAVELYRAGEELVLSGELAEAAREAQEYHAEHNPKVGMVAEYLDRLLPEGWDDMTIEERRRWLHGYDFGERLEGTVRRTRVCVAEIWAELFEGDPRQLNRMTAMELHEVLRQIPGWEPYKRSGGKLRFKPYGVQRAYVRRE